ncbi:hypothetical protein Tco_0213123 [Tanacetum coccineum]
MMMRSRAGFKLNELLEDIEAEDDEFVPVKIKGRVTKFKASEILRPCAVAYPTYPQRRPCGLYDAFE